MRNRGPERTSRDLGVFLLAGIAAGVTYAALNTLFDFWDRAHRVFTGSSVLHMVVDRVLPVIVGGILGSAIFAWRSRSRDADLAAVRADDLAGRLRGVERDQAVWVVATAALHDVRNPLHALGLLLDELAVISPEEPLVERARAQVQRVRDSLASMRKLADAAHPELVGLSLSELASEALETHRVSARKQGILLDGAIVDGLQVRGDPIHVRIVLDALLDNAIDVLRGRGGKVDLALVRTESEAILQISDDGPGVDPDLSSRLFQPLATTKSTGMGLGLSIARALSRAAGGDLTLVERPGWRTTFELRLPVQT